MVVCLFIRFLVKRIDHIKEKTTNNLQIPPYLGTSFVPFKCKTCARCKAAWTPVGEYDTEQLSNFFFLYLLVITFRLSRLKKQSQLERERESCELFSGLLFLLTDSQVFCWVKRMESDEHPVYRLCTITLLTVFEVADYESKWAKGQIRDEIPKMKGSWSYLADNILSPVFKPLRVNFSLIVEKEFERKKKDGTLTGCYRKIRDNQSDISISVNDFPTIDYDKVDSYQVLIENPLKIMSGYR